MSWTLAMPEIVLALSGLVILAVGVLPKRDTFFPSSMAVVGALLLAGVLVLGQEDGTAFGGQYVSDSFSSFMKLLVVLGGALGLLLALEPWIMADTDELVTDEDGWTLRSATGCLTAHSEHTIAITDDGAEVLTLPSR